MYDSVSCFLTPVTLALDEYPVRKHIGYNAIYFPYILSVQKKNDKNHLLYIYYSERCLKSKKK